MSVNIHNITPKTIELEVVKGTVLGASVYRGFARLCDLSNISEADIFDQKNNPLGTQRDLSPKHAKDAYNYVKEKDLAFWPEVFLCARDISVLSFQEMEKDSNFGVLKIDFEKIRSKKSISISRVDGNHRLHYAGGTIDGFPPIEKLVSFCIAYNLDLTKEIILFRDINSNQKAMNTSHLDNIESRLTDDEIQKKKDPALYISKKLGADETSPLYEKVYEGGKKPGYFAIPLRSLKTGIEYMLSQPGKLTELPNIDVQYAVIKNFFSATKNWQPEAWKDPNKHLLLRGAGFWGLCFIGATVIDKTLRSGKFNSTDMLHVLKSGKNWDWAKNGAFSGYSGRGGAVKIRDLVVKEFVDETGFSITSLAQQILSSQQSEK